MLIERFKPTWMINAIYDLTPEQLRNQGIRAVFTDLDNTLLAWNNPDGTPQLREWIQKMEAANIPIVVVSNNDEERVARALSDLKLPFISRAMKPLSIGIKKAKDRLQLSSHEVVMVGDQLITDVHAGNACNVRTILVKPILSSDAWNTSINRFFERFLMLRLHQKYPNMTWQEDING